VGTPRAAFLPSRDGFAFPNSWPPAPALRLPPPLSRIGIGNAARGLCGGMVFAALDYWHAGRRPPATRPAPGSPLYQFIVRRLIDSWHLPAGVARYYAWMNLPDGDASRQRRGYQLTVRGLRWRTVTQQWPLVRASIDAGIPAALGVVTMASAWPGVLGRNHQVLAYGYALSGRTVSVAVYDPNSGPDDRVRVCFDTADASAPAFFEHSLSIAWPVRGFFVTAYSPAAPPVTG
jgi:hypothetical protein